MEGESLPPREKLVAHGPDLLSNPELLAIVLGVGSRKESVLEMAARVVKDYGVAVLAGERDYAKLQRYLGLGPVKAMQVIATLELGRRLYLEVKGTRPVLNSAERVVRQMSHLRGKPREELRALYLNSRQVLITGELVAIGSNNYVNARTSDILRPAIEYQASGIIIVHNHPSGDPAPSKEDIRFTRNLVRAAQLVAIPVLDHVIISGDKHYSMQAAGIINQLARPP